MFFHINKNIFRTLNKLSWLWKAWTLLRKMFVYVWLRDVHGSNGSGLWPTRNQPDDIEFPARKPVADHKNQWVRLGRICLIGGRIGWSWRRCCQSFLLAAIYIFRLIFVGSERKTPNRHRICAKLTRSEQKNTKSLLDMHKTQEI